jgi:hypothetical protein
MVQPSPFQRLLQESVVLANRDAVFPKLDELFGKSLTEEDILSLGSFSVYLGATGLGRFADTANFQACPAQPASLAGRSPSADNSRSPAVRSKPAKIFPSASISRTTPSRCKPR